MAVAELGALSTMMIKEFGKPVGEKIWKVVNGQEHQESLQRAADIAQNGTSAAEALQKAFGKGIYDILGEAVDAGGNFFSYEAGRKNYIHLSFENATDSLKLDLLRQELNLNLDRITKLYTEEKDSVINHFRGCFSEWSDKVKTHLAPLSTEEKQLLSAIEKLLDGKKRSGRQVFKVIKHTGLGVMGTLLIIKGVLVAMGVGIGIIAKIDIFFFGIPGGQVAGFVLLGAILGALALIPFKAKHVMNTCTSLAYRILDNRRKS